MKSIIITEIHRILPILEYSNINTVVLIPHINQIHSNSVRSLALNEIQKLDLSMIFGENWIVFVTILVSTIGRSGNLILDPAISLRIGKKRTDPMRLSLNLVKVRSFDKYNINTGIYRMQFMALH